MTRESSDVNVHSTLAYSMFETATRICLSIVGVLYATGFAVQTLHLSRYGVTDTSVLKAEYVLTGILAFAPVVMPVVATFAIYLFGRLIFMEKPEFKFLRSIRSATIVLMVALVIALLSAILRFGILVKPGFQLGELLSIGFSTCSFLIFTLIFLCAIVFWFGEATYRSKKFVVPKGIVLATLILSAALVVFSFAKYLVVFVGTVHSRFPTGLGGAQPLEVRFYFDPLNRPPFLAEESLGLSRPMLLYGQSESSFLISDPHDEDEQSRFIQIRKDQVLAMKVKPAEY
jgi:hypothetical protein